MLRVFYHGSLRGSWTRWSQASSEEQEDQLQRIITSESVNELTDEELDAARLEHQQGMKAAKAAADQERRDYTEQEMEEIQSHQTPLGHIELERLKRKRQKNP